MRHINLFLGALAAIIATFVSLFQSWDWLINHGWLIFNKERISTGIFNALEGWEWYVAMIYHMVAVLVIISMSDGYEKEVDLEARRLKYSMRSAGHELCFLQTCMAHILLAKSSFWGGIIFFVLGVITIYLVYESYLAIRRLLYYAPIANRTFCIVFFFCLTGPSAILIVLVKEYTIWQLIIVVLLFLLPILYFSCWCIRLLHSITKQKLKIWERKRIILFL